MSCTGGLGVHVKPYWDTAVRFPQAEDTWFGPGNVRTASISLWMAPEAAQQLGEGAAPAPNNLLLWKVQNKKKKIQSLTESLRALLSPSSSLTVNFEFPGRMLPTFLESEPSCQQRSVPL